MSDYDRAVSELTLVYGRYDDPPVAPVPGRRYPLTFGPNGGLLTEPLAAVPLLPVAKSGTAVAVATEIGAAAPAGLDVVDVSVAGWILYIPDTALVGVLVGDAARQMVLVVPGEKYLIPSTSLAGWWIRRASGADVLVEFLGAVRP